MSHITVVISSAPDPDLEALELPLALAAFDQSVCLVFLGSGVFWLLDEQKSRRPEGKSPSRVVSALPLYDCGPLYYSRSDAERLNVSGAALSPLATPCSAEAIAGLLSGDQIFHF
jgi:tRNA 2-thiouridine synthesizing protein C